MAGLGGVPADPANIAMAATLGSWEAPTLPAPAEGGLAAAKAAHKAGTYAAEIIAPANGAAKGWQDYANCLGVDPDFFFPDRGASTREAKEVCKGCIVREDCLEYALANGEKFGIWGGLSERERRRIRRQRALARRTAQGLAEAATQSAPETQVQTQTQT